MKRVFRSVYFFLTLFGVDPCKAIYTVTKLPRYFRDLVKLMKQKKESTHKFPLKRLYPCLGDMSSESGYGRGAYFHQDLLVARRIFLKNPRLHVDVGSRVDGFVGHVASFRHIAVLDIRPLPSDIPNVSFLQADLMSDIREDMVEYCDSLSCLHALEHFGLGRYGDPVKYDGYLLGLNNLYRILKKDGILYFSVPIGPQRIEFNAHRVFSIGYLLELFKGKYRIEAFSYVDDKGDLHENTPLAEAGIQSDYGCFHGCGIFEMTKI